MTSNEYKAKDLFVFSKEICEQDSEFFMRSLDVDSLFTNTYMCTFFGNTERIEGLSTNRI